MHQVMPEDVKLVCVHGHTMWYTLDAVIVDLHGCDVACQLPAGPGRNAGTMQCGATLRQLTEAEDAAYAIGGFAAVEATVLPGDHATCWRCVK